MKYHAINWGLLLQSLVLRADFIITCEVLSSLCSLCAHECAQKIDVFTFLLYIVAKWCRI